MVAAGRTGRTPVSDADVHPEPPPYGRASERFRAYPPRARSLTTAVVVWALYLAGWVTGGLTTIVGLIVAYAVKGESSDAAWTHYVFAIRTIWVGLAWALIGACLFVVGIPLTLILVGLLFIKAAVVIWGLLGFWFTARAVMGLLYAIRDEPYPRPRSWLV